MSLGRALYYRIISAPGVATLFSPAQRDCATIFMLHRFQDPDRGIAGFDPAQLQRGLEYLRKNEIRDCFSREYLRSSCEERVGFARRGRIYDR